MGITCSCYGNIHIDPCSGYIEALIDNVESDGEIVTREVSLNLRVAINEYPAVTVRYPDGSSFMLYADEICVKGKARPNLEGVDADDLYIRGG